MTERPCPPGWEQRERLYPVGSAPGGEAAILRDALERIAKGIDGLDSASPSPSVQRAYEAFVLPHDADPWRRAGADQLSSCALVALSVLECLGAQATTIGIPYAPRLGRAVADVVQAGRELGAWVDSTRADAPLPSAPIVALIGDNGAGGLEHVFIGLDGLDKDGEVRVVEGGQASLYAAGYRIATGVYQVQTRAPGQTWCRRIAPKANTWRRLRGYVDLTRCAFTQRATLPVELFGNL